MELKQIVVVVRGTKGEARRLVVDAAGQILAGDEETAAMVRAVFGGRAVSKDASTVMPTEPENSVAPAVEPENSVWTRPAE